MRGKYSPTVSVAYAHDQDWWDRYANPPGAEIWNMYDPDGYDSYGYNEKSVDRAGNHEHDYCFDDYDGGEYAAPANWAYEDALSEWGFDGTKPVLKTPKKEEKKMRVYVVLEDDRGCGPSVAGVFSSLEAAQEFLAGESRCWLASDEGEEVKGVQ